MQPGKPLVVVMGVSGSGKTTFGLALAEALDVAFTDADALHSPANVQKMAAGTALTDSDREPWLTEVGTVLASASTGGMVMACSALKRRYRELILSQSPDTFFVHLRLPKSALEARMRERAGHFMPPSLLDSQLATVEPLGSDEPGIELGGDAAVAEIVATAVPRILAAVAGRLSPESQ